MFCEKCFKYISKLNGLFKLHCRQLADLDIFLSNSTFWMIFHR